MKKNHLFGLRNEFNQNNNDPYGWYLFIQAILIILRWFHIIPVSWSTIFIPSWYIAWYIAGYTIAKKFS